ncbi:hypothetical protein EYF80_051542 [Liparis tanakae]|uniref:Uncharacterized protein n=1 Tax=Liparis tanakae TaxID=230148 RepID=A0A4Z2FAW4_9TELE|nr:hypothetical protein EYF80_051542 [Liparis tanakae]
MASPHLAGRVLVLPVHPCATVCRKLQLNIKQITTIGSLRIWLAPEPHSIVMIKTTLRLLCLTSGGDDRSFLFVSVRLHSGTNESFSVSQL